MANTHRCSCVLISCSTLRSWNGEMHRARNTFKSIYCAWICVYVGCCWTAVLKSFGQFLQVEDGLKWREELPEEDNGTIHPPTVSSNDFRQGYILELSILLLFVCPSVDETRLQCSFCFQTCVKKFAYLIKCKCSGSLELQWWICLHVHRIC